MKQKHYVTWIKDTSDWLHLINPAHVAAVRLQGGVIGKESVVEVELSSGTRISAIGFGSGTNALENCAEQLDLQQPRT